MNNSLKFMLKLGVSTIFLYFVQLWIHELGHGAVAVLLGGKIDGIYVSIYGGHLDSTVPNIPYVILLTRLSGGLIASLFLLLAYLVTRNFWVEFNILTVAFSMINLFVGIVEGFFFEFYSSNLSLWSYTLMPFFLLFAYLFRRRLYTAFSKTPA